MSKANETSKAGKAANPQDTAGKATHQVAQGHQISVKGTVRGAGHGVSAADFVTKRDPDGSRGLQRLVDGGELVKAGGKAASDRAGGGVIDQGGARGAAPSAAQITAAEAGDKGSQEVVAAALSGTQAELEAAAKPDDKAK